jgi:hypothetical protein
MPASNRHAITVPETIRLPSSRALPDPLPAHEQHRHAELDPHEQDELHAHPRERVRKAVVTGFAARGDLDFLRLEGQREALHARLPCFAACRLLLAPLQPLEAVEEGEQVAAFGLVQPRTLLRVGARVGDHLQSRFRPEGGAAHRLHDVLCEETLHER